MAQYIAIRPRATVRRWLEDEGGPTDWPDGKPVGQTVHESDERMIATGLLDADGSELARIVKGPLGFDLTRAG